MWRPEGAYLTSIGVRQCNAAHARSIVTVNYHGSSPCDRPSQSSTIIADVPTTLVLKTSKTLSIPLNATSPSNVVVVDGAKQFVQSSTSNIVTSTPVLIPTTSRSTSITSSASSFSTRTSTPITTNTIPSTTTATPLLPFSNLLTSTSTSNSNSTSDTGRQATTIQINPDQSLLSTTSRIASRTKNPTTSIYGGNNPSNPSISNILGQEFAGNLSPTIRLPAEQIEQLTQAARNASPITQQALNSHFPRLDKLDVSKSPNSGTISTIRVSSTPSLISMIVAPDSSRAGFNTHALPTTLVTFAENPSISSGNGEEQTATVDYPNESTSVRTPSAKPSDSMPVADSKKSPGTAVTNYESSSTELSTGAIVGISIGSVISLFFVVYFLVWFARRRPKKWAEKMHSPTEYYSNHPRTGTAEQQVQSGFHLPAFLWRSAKQKNTRATRDEECQRVVDPGQTEASLSNPFSDINTIGASDQTPSLPPTAWLSKMSSQDQNLRGHDEGLSKHSPSHGRSLSGLERTARYTPFPAAAAKPSLAHRKSLQSMNSYTEKRRKFCSDPFDLEIDHGLILREDSAPEVPQKIVPSSTYKVCPVSRSHEWCQCERLKCIARNRPMIPLSATSRSAGQLAIYDSHRLSSVLKSGDTPRRPNAAKKSEVMFGQAL